ncbi:MAG: GNAT family N-acetyltransferase [Tissierellia bacterium]|nr:GNAT family N-acetyltransferase [Tissierellia bacterium]
MISRTLMAMDLKEGQFSKDDQVEPFFYEVLEPLAQCMYRAYLNSPEFEGEKEEDFLEELHQVLRGLYGEFMPKASFVLSDKDKILAAHLVCLYKNVPTTTYLFTDPDYRRQGLATSVLEASCHTLTKESYPKIQVYLNLDNQGAYQLYDSFGFNEQSF